MPGPSECTLVLASASPRRRRLVSWLGLPVRFMAVETPEDLASPLARQPELLASRLAADKVRAALAEAAPEIGAGDIVVGFDTIVVLDSGVLGKPEDVDDAWHMLRSLSGRTHSVVTGVAIASKDAREPSEFYVTTRVRMKGLSDEDIEAWMAKGEFMGCAGAYNIEGQVAEVDADECFQNVAGLPLCHLHAALRAMRLRCGAATLASPIATCDSALGRTCALGPRLA